MEAIEPNEKRRMMDSNEVEAFLKDLLHCPEDDWKMYPFSAIKEKFLNSIMSTQEDTNIILAIVQSYAKECSKLFLQQHPVTDMDTMMALSNVVSTSTLLLGAYLGYMLKVKENRDVPISLDELLRPFEINGHIDSST